MNVRDTLGALTQHGHEEEGKKILIHLNSLMTTHGATNRVKLDLCGRRWRFAFAEREVRTIICAEPPPSFPANPRDI